MAEDEQGVREVAGDVLRQCGYVVLEAATPAEALRTEAQYGEVIHLLVTDVIMPRMNGQDLSQQLTMRRPSLKTLFISGYTESAMIQQEMLHVRCRGPAEAVLAAGAGGRRYGGCWISPE